MRSAATSVAKASARGGASTASGLPARELRPREVRWWGVRHRNKGALPRRHPLVCQRVTSRLKASAMELKISRR